MQTLNQIKPKQLACRRPSTTRQRWYATASLAAALGLGAGAEAVSAAQPPPPPGDYSTAACVNRGATPGCGGIGGTAGAASYAQTPPGNGPIYADATAQAGSLMVNANVATGASRLGAEAGARASDYLYIDDPLAADSAWVPVRVTLILSATGGYSDTPDGGTPSAGVTFRAFTQGRDTFPPDMSIGFGTGRYGDYYTPSLTFETGLWNREWTELVIAIGGYADIDRFSSLSSAYLNAMGTIVISPISSSPALQASDTGRLGAAAATQLYSASGHNYAPVPEPKALLLMLLGIAVLWLRGQRSVQNP